MPVLERAGRSIHYTVAGEGPGVVLVPGLGSGASLFGTLPRRFAKLGFCCAAVDPVGLAPSGPLPTGTYEFDEAARDVLAVAASLSSPCALVGTSLGGKVALRASALEPSRISTLVMLCSSALVTARARRVYRMFELLCTAVDGAAFPELVAPFLFGSTFHQQRGGVVDDILRSMKPTTASRAFMQQQAAALQHFDGERDARACRVRTLCLAGTEDTLTTPAEVEATARLLANAQYEAIPHAGHSLLLESAAALDRVVAFLQSAT